MKIAGFAFSLVALLGTAHATTPSLLPMPAQIQATSGNFPVADGTSIVVPAHDAATRRTAQYLVDLLARTRGLHLKIVTGAAPALTIVLQRDAQAPVANDEGYALDVTPDGIRISARSDAGLFYGAITLWQLLTPDAKHGAVQIAAMQIRDQPRFAWRGLMLDSARHFQSVAEVEKLLDQMAQHKLNVFHWHLTDDQGWRIQIKRYPELTRIGAWRTPPDAGHDGEPQRYGGFYTEDEIRKVVAFAAARHITIVPEIDMPGHAQAAVAAYPAIGVTGTRPPVSVDWGVNPWLYNVDDATFTFIDNVLDEVMALFPSRYIHVGGDEAVKDQWQASASVQAKMHALNIKNEDALQGWMIGRLGAYLAKHGRQLVGWDEILDGHGDIQPDAVVMSWRGTKGAVDAAKAGHDVVLSPAPDLYFDGLQSDRLDETAGRIPMQSLASVYAFEPVSKELDAAQAKHVLGAQANVWTEHMPSMRHVEHATFPRLDALSEVDWSPASTHDWKSFVSRLSAQFSRYRSQQIGFADSAFAPDIAMNPALARAGQTTRVTLSNQASYGALHYTLDGTAPTAHSSLYTEPFEVTLPTTVRAATFADDGGELASREQHLDRASLFRFDGNALQNCPGSDFRLRLQPTPDATSLAPAYGINVFDTCQLIPSSPFDGVAAIHVDAVRLERNFALAHDQVKVVSRPHTTPHGELVVHDTRCDGAVLASMPLPDPQHSARRFHLDAAMPSLAGEHALCLIFTAPIEGPLYTLDHVTLRTNKPSP